MILAIFVIFWIQALVFCRFGGDMDFPNCIIARIYSYLCEMTYSFQSQLHNL